MNPYDIFEMLDERTREEFSEFLNHVAEHLQSAATKLSEGDTEEATYQYLKGWKEFTAVNSSLQEYVLKIISLTN